MSFPAMPRGGLFSFGLDFFSAVGLGMVPGVTRVVALGHNPSIGAGLAADAWEGGGDYPFQSTASILEWLSTSAADTAAGTGARTVSISGLDANYAVISEIITMNGVTPVNTVNSYLRLNSAIVVTSGSGEKNAGDITGRVTGAGATQSIIRAGYSFGRNAVYTVPNGFTLFILTEVFTILNASGANTNTATFAAQFRSFAGVKRIPLEFQVTSIVPYLHPAKTGIMGTQKTDITLRVTSAGQANTNVTAAFEAMLFDNTKLVTI